MRISLLIAASTLALGCADATDLEAPPMAVAPGVEPAPTPGAAPAPEPAAGAPYLGARQLVVLGERAPMARPGAETDLLVAYLDDADAPVAGAWILAQVLEGQGALQSRRAQTDENGEALFTLTPTVAGALRVEIAADDAASIYFDVTARAGGAGTLVVDADTDLDGTALLFDDVPCADVEAAVVSPRAHFELVGGTGRVEGLGAGARLTVAVEATNSLGVTVGDGCVEGIVIAAGDVTRAAVPVTERALQLKGRYLARHALDLSDRLGGDDPVVQQVARIGGGLDGSRGRAIVDLVCEYADINGFVCTGLRAVGGPIIDGIIEREVDPAVLRALDTLGDVYRVAASPEIEGELEITVAEPGDLGELPANVHRLTGLNFVWRDGCEARNLADCERSFDLGTFLAPDRDYPRATFDGTVADGALSIAAHDIDLPMQDVALVLAEQWLLPATLGRAGPVTLESLMRELLPCASIAAELGATLSEGLCEEVLPGALADIVRDRLADVGGVELLTLAGSATVRDRDGDRSVDALTNGVWDGATPGTFTACRGAHCE